MESKLISIIVPAYNIKDYLPRCLESILNQTYGNLEVIVISDGSIDGTNEIIAEFAKRDSRIVPIFKENSGVSDTRNCGLDRATGEYIGFVDGDDYVEPDMFECLLKNMLESDADISHCGYQMVYPSRVDYYYNTGKKVLQDRKKGIRDLIVGDYIEPGLWNKLYKREVVKGLKMKAEIRINEDVLFNYYAFCRANASVYEDKPFYHYILRKNSSSKTIDKNKMYDTLKVSKEIFKDAYVNQDYDIQSLAYSRYLGSLISLFRTISRLKLKDEKKKAKAYKNEFKKIKANYNLSKRKKTERVLFMHFCPILMAVYGFYEKFLSKNNNKYEVN